jgi:hypothetical protein
MATSSPRDARYSTISPLVPPEQPLRVDPNYPLPNKVPVPTDNNLQRTTSRRRKVSGQAAHIDPDFAQSMPTAPEPPRASKAPPLSYREPYVTAESPTDRGPSSRSFAARASAIPDRFDTSGINQVEYDRSPDLATRRDSRRASRQQAYEESNAQVFQGAPVYPNQIPHDEAYAQRTPSTRSRKPSVSGQNILQPSQAQVPAPPSAPSQDLASPVVRSKSYKASTGQDRVWAADRSPLQRLEVKLNDISKEEKRARVELAEQKLREREEAAGRRVSQPLSVPIRQVSSAKRAVSGPTAAQGQRTANVVGDEAQSKPQQDLSTLQNDMTNPALLVQRRQNDTSFQHRPTDPNRGEDRGVRFQSDVHDMDSPQSRGNRSTSGNMPDHNLPKSTRQNIMQPEEHGEHVIERQDPVPREAIQSQKHGLKYEIPPQTAAGVETRKQVGFGSRSDQKTDGPIHHRPHLSDILHRGFHHKGEVSTQPVASRHLDEWKNAEVAYLTLADLKTPSEVEPVKPEKYATWWEAQESSGNRQAETKNVRTDPEVDQIDGYFDEQHGTYCCFPNRVFPIVINARGSQNPIRVRQCIGYEGTFHSRQRNRTFHYNQRKIDHKLCSRVEEVLPNNTVHHVPFLHNLRKPYLSSKLTKDVRAIRIRVPIVPTSFTPPLLLKCGPLLRYTGLERRKLEQSPKTESETWRGSIMIVTQDSESTYDTVPTLRLFHQPMQLLPPPPKQFDEDEEGEALDSEYVDPIGGLPKLSRTGGTVYVKPVEDLDEGKDVSMIENDDGLYEETRTANVPTSYGKADEFLGLSPHPSRNTGRRNGKQVGRYREVKGIRLHAERGVTFWRFNIKVELDEKQQRIAYRINRGASVGFWVPARGQSMNIMFHSCNGFSMSVE